MIEKKPIKAALNRALVRGLKIPLIKGVDFLNNHFYPFKEPLYEKSLSMEQLEEHLLDELKKLQLRTDPSGVFSYAWDAKTLIDSQGKDKKKDLGDLCLFHHIAVAVAALAKKDLWLIHLLEGSKQFFTNKGHLRRGFTTYKQLGDTWIRIPEEVVTLDPSGDQLGGLCFGLSVASHENPAIVSSLGISNSIAKFAHTLIQEELRLLNDSGGTNQPPEYPFHSFFEQNGSAVSKLAILSLAHKLTNEAEFLHAYFHLINKYRFDLLSEFSSIFCLRWNNYFGTHITALSLASIALNIPSDFCQFAFRGLLRIMNQTKTWGNLFYTVLLNYVLGKEVYHIHSKAALLSSYFISQDSLDAFNGGERVRPMAKISRPSEDYFIQRNPFKYGQRDDRVYLYELHTRLDFCLEMLLAKKEVYDNNMGF